MTAPESFIELVRCRLVNPRRNIRRALDNQNDGHYGDSRQYIKTALEQITALEAFVNEASQRTYHTCSCGHTHYVHGDPA